MNKEMRDVIHTIVEGGAGVRKVIEERVHQIADKGFDTVHDSQHEPEALVALAMHYALPDAKMPGSIVNMQEGTDWAQIEVCHDHYLENFGWDPLEVGKRDKHSREEQLIIGAALLLAAYDRMTDSLEENNEREV